MLIATAILAFLILVAILTAALIFYINHKGSCIKELRKDKERLLQVTEDGSTRDHRVTGERGQNQPQQKEHAQREDHREPSETGNGSATVSQIKKEVTKSRGEDRESEQKEESPFSFVPPGWFFSYIPWLENTDIYKEHYNASLSGTISNHCLFCGGRLDETGYMSLTNGWRVHEKCYGMISKTMSELDSAEEARDLFDENPNVLSAFHLIHVYWTGSPPDWDERRRQALARAEGICEDCGEENEPLEIHHLIPVKRGGNHSPENLICLCRTCHTLYHRGLGAGLKKSWEGENYYKYKLDLINQALEENEELSFSYLNEDEEWNRHVVTPLNWETHQDHRHIRAYCHLRDEKRSFDVRRISKLKML